MCKKFLRTFVVFLVFIYSVSLTACVPNVAVNDFSSITDLPSFERSAINFSDVKFTSWDVEAASKNLGIRSTKPYTIMVYMNGSDLETNSGAATLDLIEMLESGLNSQYANLIVLTGGARRWLNNVVPSNTCVIWDIADGSINKLVDIGLKNMGDPGTLAGFIDFSIKNFPAEKYGLIFWDHGGGSIAGFGSDEKFNSSNLTLMDLNCAFEKSSLKNNKLEFIGFDACLMAAVEMGVVASDYADYLIASEDLEPGDGWDYSFLSVLNNNPSMDGKGLGKAIVDYYFKFYGNRFYGDLTLSVIDLNNINKVMYAMGELMNLCYEDLKENKLVTFSDLSKKRYATKTFGDASPVNNYIDMVDIGDMAEKFKSDYPNESTRIFAALNNCIVYNRHNSDTNLSGLSSYYIYGGKSTGAQSLGIYSELKMDDRYTAYLYNFFNALIGKSKARATSNEIIRSDCTLWQTVPDKKDCCIMTGILNDVDANIVQNIINNSLVPKINGYNICLFEINKSDKGQLSTVPISMNGENAELVVLINDYFPQGKILGARKEEGFKIQKGYDKIQAGDKIAFYYKTKNFGDGDEINEYVRENWYKSDEFVVTGELSVEWSQISAEDVYYSIMSTDIRNNKTYTELQRILEAA